MPTILIVDDEPGCRTATALALRHSGYAVVEADGIEEASAVLESQTPDLIISDVRMQGGGGLAVLKQVRANTRTATVPFFFMSGNTDHETIVMGVENAADGFLPKPFTVRTLVSMVSRRLGREGLARQRNDEIKFQLFRILDGAPDLIAMINPTTNRFQFLNGTGRKLLGYEMDQDLS